MKKKVLALLTCVVIILSSVYSLSFDSNAASARSILNKAYTEMKKSNSVFYCRMISYTYNNNIILETGSSISDNKMIHSFGENESWHIKSKLYTKNNWNSKWTVEKVDTDNSRPSKYYGKKYFEYILKNLKNPKIKKTTKSSYIIVGGAPYTDYKYKKIEITIDKSTKRASKIGVYYENYNVTDDNGNEQTIENLIQEASHISYGTEKLKTPKLNR